MNPGALAIAALLATVAPKPGFAGWGPVVIGMEKTRAEAALRAAKIGFSEKTLHKDGTQLLEFIREDGWEGAIYFENNETVSQIGFTSPDLSEKDAKAFIAATEKNLGKPTRGYDRPEERRGEKVWTNASSSLGVSWSYTPEKTWTVFETYHKAGY